MRNLFTVPARQCSGGGLLTVRRSRWLFLVLLLGAAFVAPQGQQQGTFSGQQGVPTQMGGPRTQSPFGGVFDNEDTAFAQRQMNALNTARQKALVSDTDKLVKLAQELNTEIESADKDSLSPEQLRKIANIEKLAHNVKQKMSESIVSGPALHDPILPAR